jgi:broad specificity phosphatase PhoE
MGRWVLVRHGVTPWNEEGRVQGHVETSLSARGRRQAELVASRLAGISFDAAYASDLPRCVETAETILASHSMQLRRTPDLREQGYGEWEGRVFREIQRDDPVLYDALMKHPTDFIPPGGEGIPALLERVGRFVSATREIHGPDETLLIVGHMGSVQALLVCLLGLPKDFITRFMLRPASVSIMGIYEDRATVEEWNSTDHLEEAP